MEEAVALTAAANTIIQDADSVGNALKTVSMRIRGTSVEELEAAGEDTDGLVESTSKLYSKIKALTAVGGKEGISILGDDGKYLNTYEILVKIAERWDEITKTGNDAPLLELIAGKTRGSVVAALLQQPEILKSAYKDALNAEGSALKENERYLDSIQGRVDLFNNAVQTMWKNTIDDDVVKWFVDVGTQLVKWIDSLGLIKTLIMGIGTYVIKKNFGYLFTPQKDTRKSLEDGLKAAQAKYKKTGADKDFDEVKKAQEKLKLFDDTDTSKAQADLDALKQKSVDLKSQLSAAKLEYENLWKTGQGDKADSSKVKELEDEIKKTDDAIKDAEKSMEKFGDTVEQTGKKGGGAFKKIGEGLKAVGKQVLETIASMAIMSIISNVSSLILDGIKWLVGEIDGADVTYEESQEELDNRVSELSNIKSEVRSLETELENTQTRMDELMSSGPLTYVEQEELDNLRTASDELERQIEFKKQLAESKQKGVNAQAITTMEQFLNTSFASNQSKTERQEKAEEEGAKKGSFWGNIIGTALSVAGLVAAPWTAGASLGLKVAGYTMLAGGSIASSVGSAIGSSYAANKAGEAYDSEQTVGEAFDNMIANRAKLKQQQDEALASGDAEAYNNATEALNNYDAQLSEHMTTFESIRNNIDWNTVDPNQREQIIAWSDKQDAYNIMMGGDAAKATAIKRVFGEEASDEVKQLKKDIEEASKAGEDFNIYEAFNKGGEGVQNLRKRLADMGIGLSEVKDALGVVIEEEEKAAEFTTYEAVQNIAELTGAVNSLKEAFEEFNETGIISADTIAGLAEHFDTTTNAWSKFVDTVSSGKATVQETADAINGLAQDEVQKAIDGGLEKNSEAYWALIAQLENMNVKNAKEFVDSRMYRNALSGITVDDRGNLDYSSFEEKYEVTPEVRKYFDMLGRQAIRENDSSVIQGNISKLKDGLGLVDKAKQNIGTYYTEITDILDTFSYFSGFMTEGEWRESSYEERWMKARAWEVPGMQSYADAINSYLSTLSEDENSLLWTDVDSEFGVLSNLYNDILLNSLNDSLLALEADEGVIQESIDNIENQIQGFLDDNSVELELDLDFGLGSAGQAFDTYTSKMQTLADIQKEIADGFIMSAERAKEFAAIYPEILQGAQTTASGQIALNKDVVNAFMAAKREELNAEIDTEIAKIDAQIATLEAENQLAQAQLDLTRQVINGELEMSADQLVAKINNSNAMVAALEAAGVDSASANKLAYTAMSSNAEEYDAIVKEVAANNALNFDQSAYDTANSILTNFSSAQKTVADFMLQCQEAAKAVAGIEDGVVAGDVIDFGGSGGQKTVDLSGYKVTNAEYVGTDAENPVEFKQVDLYQFMAQLKTSIDDNNNTIDILEGTKQLLEAQKNRTIESFDPDVSGSDDYGKSDGAKDAANEAFQNAMDYWENRIGANQARYEQVQNEIDLLEARGLRAGTEYYEEQIKLEEQRLDLLEKQKAEAEKFLDTFEEGSDEWF